MLNNDVIPSSRDDYFVSRKYRLLALPLKSPPPLPPVILPVNEKNTSDYKSLPDTSPPPPPPSSNYKYPSEFDVKLSMNETRCERTLFFLRSALA